MVDFIVIVDGVVILNLVLAHVCVIGDKAEQDWDKM